MRRGGREKALLQTGFGNDVEYARRGGPYRAASVIERSFKEILVGDGRALRQRVEEGFAVGSAFRRPTCGEQFGTGDGVTSAEGAQVRGPFR